MKDKLKTIIISDIHNRVSWIEKFIKSLNDQYDEIVFLGDYFDDFNDDIYTIGDTADWLEFSVNQPKRIHLLGNHDIWYRFPRVSGLRCGGNQEDKLEVIKFKLTHKDWDKLKLCYFTQDWLLSHAGATDKVFAHPRLGNSVTNIISKCDEALKELSAGIVTNIVGCGRARHGRFPTGGIAWCDWDNEFEPIEEINQIVGHTCGNSILKKTLWEDINGERSISNDNITFPQTKRLDDAPLKVLSENYNIDAFNQWIGIIENGKFSYIDNDYLKREGS